MARITLPPLAVNLRKFRLAAKMSKRQLADKAEVSRAAIQCFERGTYAPRIATLRRLAEVLGVSLAELAG
jgi:transcriptional regulator with XRE-family HTH domain